MIKLADIYQYKNGKKKINFFELGIYVLLKEKLRFRYAKIDGKGYFLQEKNGIYEISYFYQLGDSFSKFIQQEFDNLEISKEIDLHSFMNEYYHRRPIRNGNYVRDYLSKGFQLSDNNKRLILLNTESENRIENDKNNLIKFELRNEYCSSPPNSQCQILRHPSGNRNKSIELALFNEHRFAFYYWIKWNQQNKNNNIPDLITFDWHQDLAYPCEEEQKELRNLDLKKMFDVSLFSWSRLNPLNDNHILSAAYINQINNVWVVCKQKHFSNWEDEELVDYDGNLHTIRKFPDQESLFTELKKSKIRNLYFDIDLDYFTIENSSSNDKHKYTFMKNKDIEKMFNIENDFMKWICERMDGFTIALEPECTGGILKSLKYLKLLNKIFFTGEILHDRCEWKHLSNNL